MRSLCRSVFELHWTPREDYMKSSLNGACLRFVLPLLWLVLTPFVAWGGGFSLRFFGNGVSDIDRVKIPIDNPPVPADIGSTDITIEFWMKANPGDNSATTCVTGNDGWTTGNILIDRDVFGNGDFGDYGISLFQDGIAFGVNNGTTGAGICGTSNVADGLWHHVAATRSISDGQIRLFVDGALQAEVTGPTGDISYHDNRLTSFPNDPFLVIGAEKHDLGPGFPSFNGWIDEIRLSTVVRYTGNFTRPSAPFAVDASTAALYHFDEGAGDVINDSATGGASDGIRNFGGSPAGPVWSADKAPLAPLGIGFSPLVTSGLSQPVAITTAGDNSGRIFITEQTGAIRLWNGTTLSTFMTVPGISVGSERGALSVAFHPNYENNGFFFVYYTNTNGDIEVSRFSVSGNPDQGDPLSKQIIITIPHPGQANHNGGQLQFGPDGYLYMGTGDGGGGGDPFENAQNINVLLGKILRLNINGALPYEIPPTNPFVGVAGADEIWDFGMRNPWRFSFDSLLKDLIIGDVGQDTLEEVDLEPAGSAGGINYGWDDMEGTMCFEPSSGCLTANRVLPILEYTHSLGCSISGGYRYRGNGIPQANGLYFYGDYCSGRLWAASQNTNGTWNSTMLVDTAYSITSFGLDEAGELYLTNYDGEVHRLTGASSNISVAMSDSQDPVPQGSNFNYIFTVTNNGPSSANAVQVIDPLPAGVTYVSSTNQGCSNSNGIVTCNLGTIVNGANITFQIQVTADVLGTLTNTAIASADQVDFNDANNSDSEDTVVFVPPPQADLSITKTDDVDPVLIGDSITYTLTINNAGPDDATGVVATDDLPAEVSFVSASAGCALGGSTVTCNIGALASGNSAQATITVTADSAGVITNIASVTGDQLDPVSANNSTSENTVVIDPSSQADLSITKTDDVDPVLIGDSITYTLTINNAGPDAATGVVATDDLPAEVSFVSASAGCALGGSTVTCNIGALAAGNNAQATITVTANSAGVITNNASVTGDQLDPVSTNNTTSENTTVNTPCMFCDDFEDAILATDWTYIKTNSFWTESGGSLQASAVKKTTAIASPVFTGCTNCYVESAMQMPPRAAASGCFTTMWIKAT